MAHGAAALLCVAPSERGSDACLTHSETLERDIVSLFRIVQTNFTRKQ